MEITTRDGSTYTAKVFVDGTYEGDLLKAAGIDYDRRSRGRSKYHESFAGRQELLPGSHQLRVATSPYDDAGKLVPYVRPETDLVPVGEGDGRVMAYGYRLCLTQRSCESCLDRQAERL